MKSAAFTLVRAASIDDCVALLAGSDGNVKPIAGGQSLVPMLALRMARPEQLVDLTGVAELRGCGIAKTELFLGARVTHCELARDAQLAERLPLLGDAARHIGHDGIRNRGTLGGSLAHADPAAELPAVMTLLGATIVCASAHGVRDVPAREFFIGPYTTVLAPDELLVGVRIPLPTSPMRYGFAELSTREGDFARAGAACALNDEDDGVDLVLFAVANGPIHLRIGVADPVAETGDLLRSRGLASDLAAVCARRAVDRARAGVAA